MNSSQQQEVPHQSEVYTTASLTGAEYKQCLTPQAEHHASYEGAERWQAEGAESTTRKISSVVLSESMIGKLPRDTERVVEIPTYEEDVEYRTVKEQREVEKVVKRYYDVYQDVPKKVSRYLERPVYKDVPEPRKVEIPVPGQVIYADKPRNVYVDKEEKQFVDRDVPVIVAQTAKPVIRDDRRRVVVQARDYQPEIVPCDFHVVRPIESALEFVGLVASRHKLANLQPAQYNTLLRKLNAGSDAKLELITTNGQIEYVPDADMPFMVAPAGITIEGWVPKNPARATQSAAAYSSAGGVVGGTTTLDTTSAQSHYATTTGAVRGHVTANSLRPVYGHATHTISADSTGAVYEQPMIYTSAPASVSTHGARSKGDGRASRAYAAESSRPSVARVGAAHPTPVSGASGSATRLAPVGVQHRDVNQTELQQSNSSSVSSSINKIAYELERDEKQSYMCCGGRLQAQPATYPKQLESSSSTWVEGDLKHSERGTASHTRSQITSYPPVPRRARAC